MTDPIPKELEFIADDIAAGFFQPGAPLYLKLSTQLARALQARDKRAAEIALAIDSGRGNEKAIATSILTYGEPNDR